MEIEGSALVTGASRGLGRAVALALADRGFDVVAGVRDPDAARSLERRREGRVGSVELLRLDLRDPGEIAFPSDLRILVNNGGVRRAYLPVESTDREEWRTVFETNVFGTLEVTRQAIPVLRTAGGGVIGNVTSAAILAPRPFFGTYCGSKAAVSAITDILRLEVMGFGIRVLELVPGPIETDMLRDSTMFRPPDAAADPRYASLAERAFPAGRGAKATRTEPAEAASRIVDDLLDGTGPVRRGCDPVSAAALDTWRSGNDEERWERARNSFGGPRED
ncbi:hypothetical protein GCM10009836_44400 [Pseudonocardia ailaonensis]|uniref:Short-chain dehydrogenase n=1 Tax=Pseudonocardia ailaonensis TaxID=367279 RepID=A0ABN2NB32_9PSEU